jgi:uncharacterized protein
VEAKNKRVLIFIDEIQNSVHAFKMLRYFNEEVPNTFVIAAGSLPETTLNQNIFRYPVQIVNLPFYRVHKLPEYLEWLTREH